MTTKVELQGLWGRTGILHQLEKDGELGLWSSQNILHLSVREKKQNGKLDLHNLSIPVKKECVSLQKDAGNFHAKQCYVRRFLNLGGSPI